LFSDVECQTAFAELSLDVDDYTEINADNPNSMTLKAAHCSEPCTADEDDINVDFPSLKAAASYHEKKHDSCSAAQARKFRQCRQRTSDSVGSQHSLTEDQSQLEAAGYSVEVLESIPACNAFVECGHSVQPMLSGTGMWRELRRKSSSSDSDVAIPQRRKVSNDRELERPVIGISGSHSSKALTPMALGEFLRHERVSDSNDEQPFGFSTPMFHCTLCGDPTHRYHECSRTLGEAFCD